MLRDVAAIHGDRETVALGFHDLAQLGHGRGIVLNEVELDLTGRPHRRQLVGLPQQHGAGTLGAVVVPTRPGVPVDERDPMVLGRTAGLARERRRVAVDDGVLQHCRRLLALMELLVHAPPHMRTEVLRLIEVPPSVGRTRSQRSRLVWRANNS